MAYNLAGRVRESWRSLDDGPYRLLLEIAFELPDNPNDKKGNKLPLGRFWFGRDTYVEMLGREPSTADRESKAYKRECATAYKIVQRQLAALVKAGAVRLVEAAHKGRTAVYQILFPGFSKEDASVPLSNPNGGHERPPIDPQRGTNPSAKGDTSVRKGGHQCPPEEERRRKEENLAKASSSPERHDEKNEDHEKQDDEHDGGEQPMGMPDWFRDKLAQDKKLRQQEAQQRTERERQNAQRLKDMLAKDAADPGTDYDRGGWEDGWGIPAPKDPDREPEPPEEPGSHDGWGHPAGGV